MKVAWLSPGKWPVAVPHLFATFLVMAVATHVAGCGGGLASQTQPPNGRTFVTVLSSGTANDKIFQFSATINSLTLVSQSGEMVSLLDRPYYIELMHLNGVAEPLSTASIPQGVYTSATASLGPTGFTCATLGPNGVLATDFFGYTDAVPASDVVVKLPAPITISGTNVVLSLELEVSESLDFSSCYATGIQPFSLAPEFSLAPLPASAIPKGGANGKLIGLEGLLASVDRSADSLVVNSADGSNYGGGDPSGSFDPANGPDWQVVFDSGTVFQGISGPSQLVAGLAVDLDATIQADGSLLATRIAAYDTNEDSTSLWVVPALFENNSLGPVMVTGEKQQLGPVLGGDGSPVYFADSTFQVSKQLSNLDALPFTPGFTSANMVAGQNIGLTFHEPSYGNSPMGPAPSTITLMPQTINGTISAFGSEGEFSTYTVTLASYDLFPQLAVQAGQTTLLTNPDTVVVYADSNTQMLNSRPIAAGDVVRFYGLVFNDNGTLRMDCARVLDGVPE